MPTSEKPPIGDVQDTYYYRRKLGLRELIPAVGVGIGVGLLAYYVTRLLLQRTPLRVDHSVAVARRRHEQRKQSLQRGAGRGRAARTLREA